MIGLPLRSSLFPYTTLFRSRVAVARADGLARDVLRAAGDVAHHLEPQLAGHAAPDRHDAPRAGRDGVERLERVPDGVRGRLQQDRKSTRLNSSHANISHAVF